MVQFYQQISLLIAILFILEVNAYQKLHSNPRLIARTRVKILSATKTSLGQSNPIVDFFASFGKGKGPSKSELIAERKENLQNVIKKCPMNGIKASKVLRAEVESAAKTLEELNPTKNPATSQKMNGFWRLVYTDFDPPTTNAGKLGPFVGEVFQDLDSNIGQINNILRINFPPIVARFIGKQTVKNPSAWKIEFDRVSYRIGDFLRLPAKTFPPGKVFRQWNIMYLDDDFRILRAGFEDKPVNECFLFIFRKDEESRFDTKL